MSVNGYWLVKDSTTGHSAILGKLPSSSPSQTPLLDPGVYSKLGAKIGDPIVSYYLGGNPNNLTAEVDKALGALQISADQIPTGFTAANTPPSGYFLPLNFDILTPIGVNPNTYQQATGAAGAAANQAVQSAAQTVTSAADAGGVLAGIWSGLTNPSNWLRALEILGGAVLVYMALHSLTGAGPSAASIGKLRP